MKLSEMTTSQLLQATIESMRADKEAATALRTGSKHASERLQASAELAHKEARAALFALIEAQKAVMNASASLAATRMITAKASV